jgi:VWFA-related protein
VLCSFVISLLVPVAALAQLSRTSETINVNVVEVDVVVLDSQGKPVPGLRASDFDLRVGGHKRTITNFYEVNRRADEAGTPRSGTGATPVARRDYIVLFVDDLHLNQHEKKRALDALRTFVKDHVHAGTAAMLVALDGNLRILHRFTEDGGAIVKAIDVFQVYPARANEYDRERRELLNYIDQVRRECQDPKEKGCAPEPIPQRISALADLEQHMVEQTMNALDGMGDLISGLDGRRVLVYVSDGLPMQPGVEMYQYFKPEEFIRDDNLAMMRFMQQSQPLDAMKTNLGTKFRDLARRVAGDGVQFFAIDARGVQGFDEGIENSAASSRLDSSLIRSNLRGPIQFLADETGGRAIIDENDMNLAFAKLDDQLARYYSLGFMSEGTGREDDVSVNVKKRGLTVRAAKHVRQRAAREEIADRVRGALYARVESNPLDASVTMAPVSSGVKTTIRVPTQKLSILPGEQISFSVFAAMLDEQMRETPVRMFVHRIGSTEIAESVQTLTLEAPPGRYTVSLAISDTYSLQVSYVQQVVTIPAN